MTARRTRRWEWIVAMTVGVAAARAGAQDARLTTRLDAATRVAVAAVMDSARTRGLPTEPLASKALEGASKGADGARIVRAVRALAADLATARDALGPDASASELNTAAAALRAGVTPAALQQLRRSRGHEPVAAHLAVLVDFIAHGVPVDSASVAMLALARTSLGDEALSGVRALVDRDIALGTPPATAAAVRTNLAVNTRSDIPPAATAQQPKQEKRRP